MPNLTIREKGAEALHRIEGDRVTIGRAEHNDVVVRDARASKDHCVLERFGDRWKLVDLESHNGTKVNGSVSNQAWLQHDDTIGIGQAELRFGVEGSARRATTKAAPPAARSAGTPPPAPRAPAPPADRYDEYDDALPPPRTRSKPAGEKFLIFGGATLGLMLIIWLVMGEGSKLAGDPVNDKVKAEAERLVGNGQWQAAIDYIAAHADSSGNKYDQLQMRRAELERQKQDYYRGQREDEAREVLSRIALKVRVYNSGTMIDPADILRLMKKLKNDYAGTPSDQQAAQAFPEWYAGRVPEPDVNSRRPLRQLQKDWDEACEKADGYRKKENFREARETLIRFVSVRESTLSADALDWLKEQLERRVANIDRLAGTYFNSVERRVFDLAKNKRYDQAIELYRKVIANYGIDKYVRKAKEGIAEMEAKKREEK